MAGEGILSDCFGESEDDIFGILEALEESNIEGFEFQISNSSTNYSPSPSAFSPKIKRQRMDSGLEEGQQRVAHITVERNRRKQMNDHLSVLRSLMPCFYVKRGDQASIIGGVIDYINELKQLLLSLEAKKQRRAYNDVLSPRPSPIVSPRMPPLSPTLGLPISPSTPQPSSTYKPNILRNQQPFYLNPSSIPSPVDRSPCSSSTSSINDSVNELVASSKSNVAEVQVKFSGPNLLLNTVSHRAPGQVLKIISTLEELALEILKVSTSTVDETVVLNSFTIKIGIGCQLSAEELAHQIQQTFS